MKKIILSAAAVVVVAGLSCFALSCFTESASAQNSGSESTSSKIGLIDMAEVFKKYKKFEVLRDGLKDDIEATDVKARAMAARAKVLQDKLLAKTFTEDSPEYKRIEMQLIQLKAEFQAYKLSSQRDFMRKESQIYKTVYLEVSDAVRKYAEFYKYTLVLRFNRKSLEDAANSQSVLQSMNKQVIYSQPDDDITDSVIDYLNRIYINRTAGGTKRN